MPIMARLTKKRTNTLTVPNPKFDENPKMKMGFFAVVTSSVTSSKASSFTISSSDSAEILLRPPTSLDNSPCENPAQRLPRGVLEGIADQLRALYTNSVGESCEACIVRDISSGTKTCRNWRDGLTPLMYTNISIQGSDSVDIQKKTRLRYGARIVLLTRTLAVRPDYAQSVRELELPEYNTSPEAVAERIMAETTISGLIVRCPNLERLSGVYTPYTDLLYENPIHSALRSRRKLKEHLWLMDLAVPLQYTASESFISIHKNWLQLETLVMQGHTPGGLGGGGLNHLIFADIFTRLPSLKKLMISRFLNHEFDDDTLLSVPKSITHLRLEELPGVTEPGLQTFLCNPPRKQLTHLYLIDLELLNLLTISKLLNSLTRLQSFTLMQTSTPQPATGTSAPPLRSQTLTHLHWDTLIPAATTLLLARSIRNNNFPSLLTLRAPSDHHGTLQSACRPRESIIHPFDTIPRFHNPANPSSYTRSLPHARRNAEDRITEAREQTFMKLVLTPPVCEEEDEGEYNVWKGWSGAKHMWRYSQREEKEMDFKGFMGCVGSRVEYVLDSDVDGCDDAVVMAQDLVRRFDVCEGRGVCSGGWAGGNKIKKWGMHTERPRRRGEERWGLGFLVGARGR